MDKATIKFLLVILLASFFFACTAQAQKHLEAGDTSPNFSLYNQDGKVFKTSDYIGKKVLVLFFYPKDESMICTNEACSFRDSFAEFTKAGAIVIGINGGTVASHKNFATHYNLPYTLLSDPGDKVYKLFGIKKQLFMPGRETFVIDQKGKIVYQHAAMLQGKQHADDALKFIKAAK